MGNSCTEPKQKRSKDCQFGDINESLTHSQNNYDTVYYSFSSHRQVEIENIENYWQAIRELKTNHLVKPVSINLQSNRMLFLSNYSLKVEFADYNHTLENYSKEALQANPFIPEIKIWNLLSDIIDALFALSKEGIMHENISPQTIFIDYKKDWLLATPNEKIITLAKRISEKKENLAYLVAPEIFLKVAYDPFVADGYSLGITVIDSLNQFGQEMHDKELSEKEIFKALEYFEVYYSKNLISFLKKITFKDPKKRMTIDQAKIFIDKFRDL